MKRFGYLLMSMFLLCRVAAGQDAGFPSAFHIKADTGTYVKVPASSWQYLTEREGEVLQFPAVKGLESRFKYVKEGKRQNIKGNLVYWLRFGIVNDLRYPIKITLKGQAKTSEIFAKLPDGKWHRYITGISVPWSLKSGLKRINNTIYVIPPGDSVTFYRRDEPRSNGTPSALFIGFADRVVAAEYINNDKFLSDIIINSSVCGFLLFAAIFNFFFYYTVREKVYLYYAVLLVLVAISSISRPLEHLALREYPTLSDRVSGIILVFVFYLGFILSGMFLRTSENYPKWNKVFMPLCHCFAAVATLNYLLLNASNLVRGVLTVTLALITAVIAVGIVVTIVTDIIKRRAATRLFVLAVSPFIFCFIMVVVVGIVLNQNTSVMEYFTNFSLLWAVIALSWSLFGRFKDIEQQNTLQILENERIAREAEQQKAKLIAEQNEWLEKEVTERTAELNQSLTELKQTQSQLIQSEKMASLGELTAGIAHEIQNPLNFVNNFSEVSIELIDEMEIELANGDKEEAIAIAGDVKQNLEKIRHHGQRADSIVKGMLQHSRATSGQKEPTDLNKLADEYLRLAYHGLRAKDKSFNAELVMDYEESLPAVNIVPQDVGRVLLNLFTNAFYATQQKAKVSDSGYKPQVEVRTYSTPSGGCVVSVADNGTGIPAEIRDKIMQPFFTTKPTGEGTGLGLSLSYDIVVKGHNGKIDVETVQGQYTKFIIWLPAKT
ncbi:hypothetical protein DYU05_02500 [Mucilaginibacter terrenus]|uniref:histidine kinase n=1 Tax=Mucilaginibacter terrenus TaxID=2482727 RepID=A0A3E2NU74_9SPHI|nr:ATP-binding protein [Mucilaginibacter terrenus]RFZ84507.1 hypothetical protein DYU05_02500 [Mucilaginibacter terrenus]